MGAKVKTASKVADITNTKIVCLPKPLEED